MSAYKQFTTKDVTITPFETHKKFLFIGNQITGSDVGIELYAGIKPTSNLFISQSEQTSGLVYPEFTTGVYYNIKQLYYSNYLTSSLGDTVPTQSVIPGVTSEYDVLIGPIEAPRYDNYLQSTLSQSRYFPSSSGDKISVISIPSKLFGENIVPYTFEFNYTTSMSEKFEVIDDGDGNLISGSQILGQIFYSHGIAVFTTGSLTNVGIEVSESLSNLENIYLSFSSSYKIYENQFKCAIRENEFLYSLNPTLLSGSLNNVYYDFVTGSYFSPYVTTVGLYNNNQDLIAVGKLSQPIPISKYIDTTIIVNFDII